MHVEALSFLFEARRIAQQRGKTMRMVQRYSRLDRQKWRERGQGLVEYAMILVMMAIVVLVILTYLGSTVFNNYYSKIGSNMASVVH